MGDPTSPTSPLAATSFSTSLPTAAASPASLSAGAGAAANGPRLDAYRARRDVKYSWWVA